MSVARVVYPGPRGSLSLKLLQIFLKVAWSCQNFLSEKLLKISSLWKPFLQSDSPFLPNATRVYNQRDLKLLPFLLFVIYF